MRTSEFSKALNAEIVRDENSNVRAILNAQPTTLTSGTTARAVAENYLRTHGVVLGVALPQLSVLQSRPQTEIGDRGVEYRFEAEKTHSNLSTVVFRQTYLGLPIWEAGISVHVKQELPSPNWLMRMGYWLRYQTTFGRVEAPAIFEVVSSHSTLHGTITVAGLEPRAERLAHMGVAVARAKALEARTLAQQLGITLPDSAYEADSVVIRHQRLMIYRYRAADRVQGFAAPAKPGEETENPLAMPLPAVPSTIADENHYVVSAVYFDLKPKRRTSIHWVALVEIHTQSVLYLEPFAADLGWRRSQARNVRGLVFLADPMTTNNGPGPDGSPHELNLRRELVSLLNLHMTNPQKLSGSNIRVANFQNPSDPAQDFDPPTKPAGADFDFDAATNRFAAVNAYYHCDRFFNLVEELGFTRANYFPGTNFPIEVDHRGTPDDNF